MNEELQHARRTYEALNAQLLDELPQLYVLTLDVLKECIARFVHSQKNFFDKSLQLVEQLLSVSEGTGCMGGGGGVNCIYSYYSVSLFLSLSLSPLTLSLSCPPLLLSRSPSLPPSYLCLSHYPSLSCSAGLCLSWYVTFFSPLVISSPSLCHNPL